MTGPRERDHWFKFNSAKWRDSTRGLSPGAKGIYADLITLLHDTPDAGYTADAGKIARDLGYRDKRTVAAPLAELMEARKLLVWRGRLYSPMVCRDRHALAVRRKERSPVPAEVWPLIEAMEKSTDTVDDPVDEGGGSAQPPHEIARSSADVRPMIENSGAQVVDFPRKRVAHLESELDHEVVVAMIVSPRARGDPATVRA